MLKKPGRLSRRMLSQVSAAASAPLLLQFPPPPAVRSTSLSLSLSLSVRRFWQPGRVGRKWRDALATPGFSPTFFNESATEKAAGKSHDCKHPVLILLGGLALISRKSVALILLVGFRVLLPDSVRPAP